MFLNRASLVDRTGFHTIGFLAGLKLQSTTLLAGCTSARISEAGSFFADELGRGTARHAHLFADWFANLLADSLGFAYWAADLFANRLHDALFNLLAGGDSAILEVGFANWLADSLGNFLLFCNLTADLELHVPGLRLSDWLANNLGAFLVGRFANWLAFSNRLHDRFVHGLANDLLAVLVVCFVNGLVAGLFHLTVFDFVHSLGYGALLVAVSGASLLAHLHFFHVLIRGVLSFFDDGVIDRLVAGAIAQAEIGQTAEEARASCACSDVA